MTKVIYRTFKDNGDTLALFPQIAYDRNGYLCQSYQRIGQHGSADYNHCIAITNPASASEIQALERELVSIGYDDLRPAKQASYSDIKTRMENAR